MSKARRLNADSSKAVEIAVKQLEAGLAFKQPRMDRIRQIEEMYLLKEKPALWANTTFQMLNSKVRNTTELEFGNSEKESAFKSGKITDAWRVDSDHEHADWPRAERVGRFLASISGRAILGNMCALSGELRNELDLKRTDPLLMFATVNPRIVS